MKTKNIDIDPRAALGEAFALVEFYRNRNLILANEALALAEANAGLEARLALVEAEFREWQDLAGGEQ